MKERAARNRTITVDTKQISELEKRLLLVERPVNAEEIVNKTINGDIFKVINYLPDAFADLLIVDPPYNLSKDFNGNKFSALKEEDYISYLRSWIPLVVKKLKPEGSLYLCCDWKSTAAVYTVLSEQLTVLNRITWQREKGRGALNNWKNGMEDIWFAVKDKNKYYFNVEAVKQKRRVIAPYKVDGQPKDWEETEEGKFRLTFPSNFWDDISIPYWSMPENTDHPTQKPEKLLAKLILASSGENDIVFDPFLGSGTTSVVAKKLNRRYCGIEMNTEYACLAEKRLEMADSDTSIQGYSDGVFWERNTLATRKKKTSPKRSF